MDTRLGKRAIAPLEAFNYVGLSRETAAKARASAERIRARVRTTMNGIIDIGMDLRKARAVLDHGLFGKWLRAEFAWSERTAENFMAVADRFGPKFELISDLAIQPTAAYYLARPSVPDEVRIAALRRAEAGERITLPVAKEILETVKRRSRPTSEPALALRLKKLLCWYKERCNQEEIHEMAELLRAFADSMLVARPAQPPGDAG